MILKKKPIATVQCRAVYAVAKHVAFLMSKHCTRDGKESLKDSDGVFSFKISTPLPLKKTNGMTLLNQKPVFLDKQYNLKKS
jgi:hypothetical protein